MATTTSVMMMIMATMAVLLITLPSPTQAASELPTDPSALTQPDMGVLPSCLKKVMSCQSGATQACCTDLQTVMNSAEEKSCLCNSVREGNMYSKLFGMDISNVLLFTQTCGIVSDANTVCPGVKLNSGAAAAYSWTGFAAAAAIVAPLVL